MGTLVLTSMRFERNGFPSGCLRSLGCGWFCEVSRAWLFWTKIQARPWKEKVAALGTCAHAGALSLSLSTWATATDATPHGWFKLVKQLPSYGGLPLCQSAIAS